jgi:hypothetical protein
MTIRRLFPPLCFTRQRFAHLAWAALAPFSLLAQEQAALNTPVNPETAVLRPENEAPRLVGNARVDVTADATDGSYPMGPDPASQAKSTNYQGLWWNSSESGWGLSITQKGSTIFAAAYTFDADGRPAWYVLTCPLNLAVCTGALYRVTDGTAPTLEWGGTNLPELVGEATLSFLDARNARFQFTILGRSGIKTLTPFAIATAGTTPQTDFTDMWWNANESGWGISINQQFTTIFAAWYTYDTLRKPVWYVAPLCVLTTASCSSRLYRVAGGSALTSAWAPSLVSADVGSVTFTFSSADAASMTFTIDGAMGSRSITRLAF